MNCSRIYFRSSEKILAQTKIVLELNLLSILFLLNDEHIYIYIYIYIYIFIHTQ